MCKGKQKGTKETQRGNVKMADGSGMGQLERAGNFINISWVFYKQNY